MDKKDSYKLNNSFAGLEDTERKAAYRQLLDDYNDLVEVTQAFIRMTRAIPAY